MTDLTRLRAATEDDVTRALAGAYVKLDAPAADLSEFFNRMLDVVGVEEAAAATEKAQS